MNAESSRLRSTGITSSDMRAIWPAALLVVYLVGTGVLLITGSGRIGIGVVVAHFAILFVVAAATWTSIAPMWVRSWLPLLLLLFFYSELPALIEAAGHTEGFDAVVIRLEQSLFGTQPAQSWARAIPAVAVSEPLHLAYLAYYPIIYAVPVLLWRSERRSEFHAAVFALILTFVACFVCYIMLPVAGPRYLWQSAAPEGFFRSTATWLLEARSSRGTAFPSSHVAVSVAQSVLAIRFFGVRGAVVAVIAGGLAAGAVYGGFHYAVDVLAGALLGLVTAFGGLRLMGALAPDQAKAIAPTYSGSER